MEIITIISTAFILDLIIGDPTWIPHPIRFIGSLIKNIEKLFRKIVGKSEKGLLISGVFTVLIVVSVCFFVPWAILKVLGHISPVLKFIVEVLMCTQILATKSLKKESMRVYYALAKGDILEARKYLSWIVGRDTTELSEQEIVRATVETVAENTTDGVVAPLIFMAIGGAPLGFFYKAVNTMDSMIGYKNEKYFYYGKAAARFDDLCNFIPAIITGYLMIAASFVLRMNWRNAYKIYRRDRYNHKSPNSAKTESVCAGALEVQLGGTNIYFGKPVVKPTIGDKISELSAKHIILANSLMYMTSVLAVIGIDIILFLGGKIYGI